MEKLFQKLNENYQNKNVKTTKKGIIVNREDYPNFENDIEKWSTEKGVTVVTVDMKNLNYFTFGYTKDGVCVIDELKIVGHSCEELGKTHFNPENIVEIGHTYAVIKDGDKFIEELKDDVAVVRSSKYGTTTVGSSKIDFSRNIMNAVENKECVLYLKNMYPILTNTCELFIKNLICYNVVNRDGKAWKVSSVVAQKGKTDTLSAYFCQNGLFEEI